MKQGIYETIQKECEQYHAKLVVVSKYRSNEQLMEYYEEGQRDFGENRVQELVKKAEELPKDIHWHMIGHLQSNKVKYIAPFIAIIHSIHSLSLLDEVEKQAKKNARIIPVCIQFNLAKEDSKSGFHKEEWEQVMLYASKLSHIEVVGIMVMGPHVEDATAITSVFKEANALRNEIALRYPKVKELSMGMSHDYPLALKENATMIRVGSILFD